MKLWKRLKETMEDRKELKKGLENKLKMEKKVGKSRIAVDISPSAWDRDRLCLTIFSSILAGQAIEIPIEHAEWVSKAILEILEKEK